MDSLFTNLINEFYYLDSIKESVLVAIRKPLRAKYGGYGRTGYKEETYYKLYPKQRPSVSSITNILFAAYSDVLYNILFINPYSMPVVAYNDFSYNVLPVVLLTNSHIPVIVYSDFLYNILPIILLINSYIPVVMYSDFLYSVLSIASLINSYMPVIAYSDFSHNISFIILLINLYSVLPIIAYSKSIDRSALSVKYLSSDWILDTSMILYIYCNINLFNKIAPTLVIII